MVSVILTFLAKRNPVWMMLRIIRQAQANILTYLLRQLSTENAHVNHSVRLGQPS